MTNTLHSKRLALKCDLGNIDLKHSKLWAQRARKNLLKEGDENTTYFHKICTINQRKSLISEIEDSNGSKFVTTQAIVDAFILHYQNLYKDVFNNRLWISNLRRNPINPKHHNVLHAKFSEVEIRKAIESFNNGKAPGPNGFPVSFYKKNGLSSNKKYWKSLMIFTEIASSTIMLIVP